MKILISGTRNGVENIIVRFMVDFVVNYYDKETKFTLIHGTAKGVDTQGAQYAQQLGWEIKPFKPDWSKGKRAGLDRNSDMVNDNPDFGIFIPIKTSRGTYDCLEKYKSLGKPYILYDFNKRTFTLHN